MHLRGRSNPYQTLWLLVLTALFSPLTQPLPAQENEVKIDPFQTERDDLGETLDFNGIQYNDTTGKLSYNLPAIGPDGLSLQGVVRSTRRVTACELNTCVESQWPSIIGHHGSLGFGRILVYNPMDNAPQSQRRLPNGRLSYIDPQGNGTAFKRDYLFQDIDPQTDFTNTHFIDEDLRRITRDTHLPFGQAQYYLLQPDGSKTVFQAYTGHLPGGQLSDQDLLDPQLLLVYYPVQIIAPNGRTLEITYQQPLNQPATSQPTALDLIRPSQVDDDWGRRLIFHYYQSGPFAGYLERLGLGTPANTITTAKPLMAFDYVQSGGYVRLASFTTPAGYQTQLSWQTLTQAGVADLNVLKSVTTPSGLELVLNHGLVEIEHISLVNNPKHLRVLNLEKRVNGAPIYRYTYQYQKGLNLGGEFGDAPGPHSWMKVTMIGETVGGGPRLERESYYYNNGPAHDDNEAEGLTPYAGKRRYRVTSYTDGLGVTTQTHEKWDYQQVDLWSTAAAPPTWLLNQDTLHPVKEADTHKLFQVRTSRYAKQMDGVWTVLDLEYQWMRLRGLPLGANHLNGAILMPVQLTQYPQADPTTASRQTFVYDNLHVVVTPDQSAAGHAYNLARRRVAQEARRHDGLAFGTVKRLEFDYAVEPQNYQPGVTSPWDLWPLVTQQRVYAASNNVVETTNQYYIGGPWAGMLRASKKGISGADTQYEAYRFGRPGVVQPPLGVPKSTTYNIDGTAASETMDGVTTQKVYDADGRLIRTTVAGGLVVDEATQYASPGQKRAGNDFILTQRGDRWERKTYDPFGRVIAEGHNVETGVEGDHTTTQYDLLGNARWITHYDLDPNSQTPVVKSLTKREVDIQGRLRRELIAESSAAMGQNRLIAEKYIAYNGISDGDLVRLTRYTKDGRTSKLLSRTDFFGRQVNAGMEVADTPGQMKYTHFTYRFDGEALLTTIQPEGHDHFRQETRDWMGRMVREQHPEMEGTTRYVYNDRGLLLRLLEAGGPAWSFEYDAMDREIAKNAIDPATGQIRHRIYTKTYNDHNQLQAVDHTNGVFHEITEFDALNRPAQVRRHIPQADAAPTHLQPTGGITALDRLDFSWTGQSPSYILELAVDDLPTLIFDVPGDTFSLTRAAFTYAVQSQVTDPDTQTALLPFQGNSTDEFLNPQAAYQWRVRGLDAFNILTQNSDWIKLSGTVLTVEPGELNFGDQLSAGVPVILPLTVTNIGADPLTLGANPEPGPFSLLIDSLDLAPGATTNLDVRFMADDLGAFETTVEVLYQSTSGIQGAVSVPVTAVVTDAADPIPGIEAVAGFNGDFGAVPSGEVQTAKLRVKNLGGGLLNASIRLEGEANHVSAFTVNPNQITNLPPFEQDPAHVITLDLTFTPHLYVEDYQVTMIIQPEQGAAQTIPLTGSQYFDPMAGEMSIAPFWHDVDFGQILMDETAEGRVQIVNIEPDSFLRDVQVTLIGPDADKFRVVDSPSGSGYPADCGPLYTNQPCYARLIFDPAGASNPAGESFHATAVFSHPGDADIQVSLRGTAKAPANLNVSFENQPGVPISTYDFGNRINGIYYESQPLRINNTGGLGAAVFLSLSGPDAAAFGSLGGLINNPAGTYIDGGNYASTIITFSPTEPRPYAATLHINAPDINQSFALNLRGIGETGQVFGFTNEQRTQFPAGGVGKTVTLPLRLINNTGTFIGLTMHGTGDFEGRVKPYGGQDAGPQYLLPMNGSYDTDFIEFTIPRKGPLTGQICFTDQAGNTTCRTFGGDGVDSMKFTYPFANTSEPITVLKPVQPTTNARDLYNAVKTWGVGRPFHVQGFQPSGREIVLSVPEPFKIFKFSMLQQWDPDSIAGYNTLTINRYALYTIALVTDVPGEYQAQMTAVISDVPWVDTGLGREVYTSKTFTGTVTTAQIQAPDNHNFLTVPLGQVATHDFQLINTGAEAVELQIEGVEGDFNLSYAGTGGRYTNVALSTAGTPGDRVNLEVSFKPTAAAATQTRTLTFRHRGVVVHQLNLSGRGGPAVPAGSLGAQPLTTNLDRGLNLGAVAADELKTVSLDVTNHTEGDLEGAWAVEGFGKGAVTVQAANLTLTGKGTTTVEAVFQVHDDLVQPGDLVFLIGGQVHHRIPVSYSIAQRPFTVPVATVRWDEGLAGDDLGVQSLPFTNHQAEVVNVSITTDQPAFTPAQAQAQVPAGATVNLDFNFTPQSARIHTAKVFLTVDGKRYQSGRLQGIARAVTARVGLTGQYMDDFNQWYWPEGEFYDPPHEDLNEPQIEHITVINQGREAADIRVEFVTDPASFTFITEPDRFQPPAFDHHLAALGQPGNGAVYEMTYNPYIGMGLGLLQIYADNVYQGSTLVWIPFPQF